MSVGKSRKAPHMGRTASSALVVGGLLFLLLWPSLAQALPLTTRQELLAVWQQVDDVGQYAYHSTVLQTTNPVPKLRNVGRGPSTQQIQLSGQIDKWHNELALTMRMGNREPVAIKVVDGISYGRTSSAIADPDVEWTELDEPVDLFAPGGDPLGFVAAATDVQTLAKPTGADSQSAETLNLNTLLPTIDHGYAFAIDGLTYAKLMRDEMESYLRRKGSCPSVSHWNWRVNMLTWKAAASCGSILTACPCARSLRSNFRPNVMGMSGSKRR
ncbi:MAG: hypothetical protein R2932_44785 [Caldilineaceae bacterium]